MKEKVLSNTKAKLIDIMKCGGEISVEEGAEALDLATTTVRQHLGKLEDQGFVKTRHERYGRGRPLKMYSLTDESDVWYENRESDILVGLIEYLEDNDAEHLIHAYFEELTDGHVKTFEQFATGRAGSRSELLYRFMKLRGFVPDCLEANSDGEVKISLCHCPCRAAAKSSTVVCDAEKRFLERALGQELTRTKHIVEGDAVCEYAPAGDPDSE